MFKLPHESDYCCCQSYQGQSLGHGNTNKLGRPLFYSKPVADKFPWKTDRRDLFHVIILERGTNKEIQ